MIQARQPFIINLLANHESNFPWVSAKGHKENADVWRLKKALDANPQLARDAEFMAVFDVAKSKFRPFALDFAEMVADPDNYHFFHNGSHDDDVEGTTVAMLFEWSSPNVFEFHTMSLPTARGGDALKFAQDCVAEMYLNRGAREIWGQTPIGNVRARHWNKKLGGIPRGTKHHWMFGECELFATTRDEWQAFHNKYGMDSNNTVTI